MRTTTALLLALAGCSGSDEGSDSPTTDKTGTPTEETGTTVNPTTDTEPADKSASLAGSVVDATGAPVAGAHILFCRGVACRTEDADGSGAFSFDDVEVDWHSLEIKPPKTGPAGLATVFAPVVFATDEARTIDLVMPALDAPTPMPSTPTEVEMGAGLYVTISADDIEPPLLVDPATEVAGVLLEQSQWVPTDEISGTVLAQWLLSPFDHHAEAGLPVRIENTLGLADSTTVRVWVGSYVESQWLDAGTLTASGGWLEGDAALPLVSTVVLVQE